MAHSESILLAGMCDENQEIRLKCFEIIINARSRKSDTVRPFKAPGEKLVFEADSYLDMIDLTANDVTDPPLLRKFDTRTLRKFATNGKLSDFIPKIPCHSVNNERCIKDTTTASQRAVGVKKLMKRF